MRGKWIRLAGLAALLLLAAFLVWAPWEKPIASPAANSVNGYAPKQPTVSIPLPQTAPDTSKPRPATAAPRFNTIAEYRAEMAARPAPAQPLDLQPAVKTPEAEVRRWQLTMRKYRAALGQNPVGSNPEITRALLGGNATGARFLDRAGVQLNERGESVDEWGTPYFFHAVSGSIMEVRSAGPDRKLFTEDDIVR